MLRGGEGVGQGKQSYRTADIHIYKRKGEWTGGRKRMRVFITTIIGGALFEPCPSFGWFFDRTFCRNFLKRQGSCTSAGALVVVVV